MASAFYLVRGTQECRLATPRDVTAYKILFGGDQKGEKTVGRKNDENRELIWQTSLRQISTNTSDTSSQSNLTLKVDDYG